MTAEWTILVVFVVCYILLVVFPNRRSIVACAAAAVLVISGSLTWQEAILEKVNWNVTMLFLGTLALAELFMESRMPAVMAEWLVDKTRTARGAMIAVCVLAGVISAFVENVAVVLLIAPVALSLSEKLRVSPVRLLICISACANLQGTATLIGDPPSMILAGYMKMSFNDFIVYMGKPGIFFAVEVGAVAATLVVAFLLREHTEPVTMIPVERVRAWTPTVLLTVLVLGLSVASFFDPEFKWLAGGLAMILASAGLVWRRLGSERGTLSKLVKSLDWDTTFFLIGVFVVVGALSDSGWLDKIAVWISGIVGGNLAFAFALIVLVSVVVSGFVDNVPFLLAMIPVAQKLADGMNAPVPVLMFGLLIGACLGGNLTPIGASANVVTCGMLRKRGHPVSFLEFSRVGIPFTVAAVVSACLFVWLIWAP